MKNDITDLMWRCRNAFVGIQGNHWRRKQYKETIESVYRQIVQAGKEHIEEATMKDFIASVEEFEKYVRGQK